MESVTQVTFQDLGPRSSQQIIYAENTSQAILPSPARLNHQTGAMEDTMVNKDLSDGEPAVSAAVDAGAKTTASAGEAKSEESKAPVSAGKPPVGGGAPASIEPPRPPAARQRKRRAAKEKAAESASPVNAAKTHAGGALERNEPSHGSTTAAKTAVPSGAAGSSSPATLDRAEAAGVASSSAARLQEATHEGAAVMSALAANVVIALVKFIIGLFGVQAMMGEAIHSAADCINEVVLIKGKDASKNPPTRDHPLGTVRMQYLAGLAVAVIVCGLGGVYTIVEAFHKINSMVTTGPSAFDVDPKLLWISIIVAVVAACAEGWSLHKSYKEAQEAYRTTGGRGKFSAVKFWAGTKNSELTSVLAEDTLALVGLAFVVVGCAASLSTGNEIWDAISSMMIGFVLILGGLALAWQNTSLLLGEGVNNRTYDAIEAVLEANQDVERVLRKPVAWHESAYKIRCEIKVQLKSEKAMKKDKEAAINDLEDQIRKALPSRYQVELWIEPDKYDPELAKKADLSDHSDD